MAWTAAAKALRALHQDERGAAAVLVALMLLVIGGSAALAVDVMRAYSTHEELQTAAEAAAAAGVYALHDKTEARRVASLFAERNRPAFAAGTTPVMSDAEVEFGHWSTQDKVFTGEPTTLPLNAVRATASLTQTKGNALPTWFGGLFGVNAFDIRVSAIALAETHPLCLLTLDPSGAQALKLDSNAVINAPKCEVHSRSTASDSLHADSNAKVTSKRTCVEGGYVKKSNAQLNPLPETRCDAAADPFAAVPTPTVQGCVRPDPVIDSRTATLEPCAYTGLTIKGNSTVTFKPGNYEIRNGKFTLDSNTKVSGDGVGFLLTGNNGLLEFNSNSEIAFTAPQSGPLSGFVFYQDPRYGGVHRVDSNVAAKLDGAIYLPKAKLHSKSNSTWGSASTCLMIVAHRVEFDSNSGFNMDADFSKCPWLQSTHKRSKVVG